MAQQPTQVLPSNAPPLRESFVDHAAQRTALQEYSSNRQQIYHQHIAHPHSLNIYDQHKLACTPVNGAALSENAYTIRQPHNQASYYNQPQVYYPRPSWPRGYQDRDADARARVAEGWQSLYNRFVNCPRYKDYRSRQHKDGKNSLDQKWPEHLEQAFFKGMFRDASPSGFLPSTLMVVSAALLAADGPSQTDAQRQATRSQRAYC